MKDLSFLKERMIAHRGLHDKNIPENTISSFKRAINNNYIIELDVHLLKDNKVVVIHDDNLIRASNINKKIKDMTYDEVKMLNIFNTCEHIPLLEDVLDIINGCVPIIIELKTDVRVPKLEKQVLKILKNYHGLFAIQSFSPLSLYYIKKKNHDIIIGQLVSDFKNNKMNFIKKFILKKMIFNILIHPDFISCNLNYLSSNKIKKLRKNKIILGWTVRNINQYEDYKELCDNVIFENIPEILKQ